MRTLRRSILVANLRTIKDPSLLGPALPRLKILTVQFKSLGDTVMSIPTLNAIYESRVNACVPEARRGFMANACNHIGSSKSHSTWEMLITVSPRDLIEPSGF